MAPGLSSTAIDNLGKRLAKAEVPTDADREMLQEMLTAYDEPLAQVAAILTAELGLHVVTTRIKTEATLLDKLRREHGRLSKIRDLAGARVLVTGNRVDQDRVVREIAMAFDVSDDDIIDRRKTPNHGYRAVHVIVQRDGRAIEVQVRTELQDRWAQVVEKLGDLWGRAIRYGGRPVDADRRVGPHDITREQLVIDLLQWSDNIAQVEDLEVELFELGQPPGQTTSGKTAVEVNDAVADLKESTKRVVDLLEALALQDDG